MTVHTFERQRRDRRDVWLLNWKTPFWICQSGVRRMGRWKTTDCGLSKFKTLDGSNWTKCPVKFFSRPKCWLTCDQALYLGHSREVTHDRHAEGETRARGRDIPSRLCCSLVRSACFSSFARQESDEREYAMLAGQKFVWCLVSVSLRKNESVTKG